MPSPKIHNEPKVRDNKLPTTPPEKDEDRERLRDILVVFVTYPITPTERTEKLANSKPWLEFLSLLLKAVLAAYAVFEAVNK